jgi:hypothetical protein
MKNILSPILMLLMLPVFFSSCEKDMEKSVLLPPAASSQEFKASTNNIVLSTENKTTNVVTFSFNKPDYGIDVLPSYTLQFTTPADTVGENAWTNAIAIKLTLPEGTSKSLLGVDLNAMLVTQLKLAVDEAHKVVVRLVTDVTQNSGASSTIQPLYSKVELTVTPFEDIVIYPALLVKGGNSWLTPTERTNGYLLTSAQFNSSYEGYLNLPNADGWGGDAFQLINSLNGNVYGWGTDSITIAKDGGNLWLTPSPAYMKVNVDLEASTIKYVPVTFYISGDDNGWSTSSTPMTYNSTTKQLEVDNLNLTAGNSFAFTCNDTWDLSYKIDAKGKIIFAGAPGWAGSNIPIEETGVYKVILDMSGGNGNYSYEMIKK